MIPSEGGMFALRIVSPFESLVLSTHEVICASKCQAPWDKLEF